MGASGSSDREKSAASSNGLWVTGVKLYPRRWDSKTQVPSQELAGADHIA